MNKRILLLTCAMGGALSLGATGAFAATATDTSQAAQSSVVDIVVTAEKREQNLQEVPVAISAYTSAQRDLIGISNIQDMTDFTPGLVYSTVLDRASIRGVGRLTNNLASDAAVAVYSDGFFTTSTVEAGKPSMFSERVEVLRGPQGTLYGRNSIGGAINVISKRPTKDLYAEVQAIAANFGFGQIAGAISGPLSDKVRMRFAAYDTEQNEGYYKNVAGGPSEGNVYHQWYAEAQLEADVGDNGNLWMKFASASWRNRGGPGARGGYTAGHYDFNFDPPTATLGFNNAYAYTLPTTAYTAVGSATDNPALTNVHNFSTNVPLSVHLDNTYIFDLQYTQHFDNFDIKYVGGYDTYRYDLNYDFDGTSVTSITIPLNPGSTCSFVPGCAPLTVHPSQSFEYLEDNHWYSHELNISSNKPGDALQWIAGLFYYDEGYHEPENIYLKDEPAAGSPVSVNFTTGTGYTLGSAPNPTRSLYYFDYKMRTQSIAGYAQIDYKFADTWKFTAGVRYTHDHKNGNEYFRSETLDPKYIGDPRNFGNLIGQHATDWTPVLAASVISASNTVAPANAKGVVTPMVLSPYVTQTPGSYIWINYTIDPATGIAIRQLADNFSAVTGTLGIQWDPSPDTMLYARYSRGYKSGGFTAGTIQAAPETNSEHINAYEVGMKKDFGRTLQTNIAIFYYDYSNFQAPVSISNNGVIQGSFLNIPKARSDGVEFEGTWAPVDNLRLTVSYSYNDSSILSDCIVSGGVAVGTCLIDTNDPYAIQPGAKPRGPAIPTAPTTVAQCNPITGVAACTQPQSIRGNTLPQDPKNKIALNANYTWTFDAGSLTLSGTYIWRDKQYGSLFTRAYNSAPSWSQTDFRLMWKAQHDRYEVIGFVRNAFDQAGYEAATAGGRVFATSATTASPTAQSPYTISNVYGLNPPRTFGVEFHYKFF